MKAVLITSALLSCALAGWFGRGVPYSEQYAVFDGLRQTASIMFGVFGAWLAIVYRKDLTLALLGKNSAATREINEVDEAHDDFMHVYQGVLVSSLVVAVILIAGYAAPIIRQTSWCRKHAVVIRGISFAAMGLLTLIQLSIVWISLAPMVTAFCNIKKAKWQSAFLKRR